MRMTKSNSNVGYCSPPDKTRFRPGVSGNPRGRPKGARSFRTELLEELSEQAPANDGSAPNMTNLRAIVRRLVANAIGGDPRAINTVIACCAKLLPDENDGSELSIEDQQIANAFAKRRRASETEPAPTQTSTEQ